MQDSILEHQGSILRLKKILSVPVKRSLQEKSVDGPWRFMEMCESAEWQKKRVERPKFVVADLSKWKLRSKL